MSDHTPTTTRRTVLEGLAGAAATASLAGCTGLVSGAGSDSSGETSLRYAQVIGPPSLDPVVADDVWSRQVINRVFEGLYTFGEGTDVVPLLAAGSPTREEGGANADGESSTDNPAPAYTVEIRDDATFQDGTPVTAADVRYSFEAPVEEDAVPKWALTPIETIETPDERTVRFELAHPYPAFEYALTRPVVPKTVREADPEGFAADPVGSGPYEVATAKRGSYVKLQARDDYWRDTTPSISNVTFVGNHSGLARTTSLRTGQNELVERVQPKLWSVTEGLPDARVTHAKSFTYVYVGFNCRAGPTEDPKVREAIDYLVDMNDLVEHFVAPKSTNETPEHVVETSEGDDRPWRQHSPIPDRLAREWGFPVEEWREVPRERNPERARQLLEEAGVSSWSPKVVVPKDVMREKFAEALVHGLSDLGFRKARTESHSWSKYRELLRSGAPSEYDMFVGSWAGWPDPDSFLYPLFHENAEGATNFTYYRNEGVMNDLMTARETRAREERKPLYESAVSTLLEDRVHLPAATLHNTFGAAEKLEGFEPHPIASVNPRFVSPDGHPSLSVTSSTS